MHDPIGVHVKVDTGMHRIGVWPPDATAGFIERTIAAGLVLDGLWTHLACADSDEVTTKRQLDVFQRRSSRSGGLGHAPRLLHAANTAGAVGFPLRDSTWCARASASTALHRRPASVAELELRPALTWRSAVSFVKRLPAGDRVSYGHRARSRETRGWPRCRWATPTATLACCRRAPMS